MLQVSGTCILINGSPTIPFKLHRGLRQWDPFSPFLFDMIVETLSLVFQNATNLGLRAEIEISRGGTKLTHLQFADVLLYFVPQTWISCASSKRPSFYFNLHPGYK